MEHKENLSQTGELPAKKISMKISEAPRRQTGQDTKPIVVDLSSSIESNEGEKSFSSEVSNRRTFHCVVSPKEIKNTSCTELELSEAIKHLAVYKTFKAQILIVEEGDQKEENGPTRTLRTGACKTLKRLK